MARVLIIEDDPFIRGVYEKILTKSLHTPAVAKTGEEGLEVAETFKPDLIILDMLMPGINGIEFLKRYDIPGKHPNVKVIVLSNMMMQDKINEAVNLGAVNYKQKAMFSPREMVELIDQTLGIS